MRSEREEDGMRDREEREGDGTRDREGEVESRARVG